MRRDSNRRERREEEKKFENKLLASGSIIFLLIAIIIVCIILYANQIKSDSNNDSELTTEKLSALAQNVNTTSEENTLTVESTESASTQIGKSVEESKNQTQENTISEKTNNSTNNAKTSTSSKTTSSSNKKNTTNSTSTEKTEVVKKEITFIQPVEGDIIKEFAKENLVYSNTLEEWVTHLGVDIKADKTTVVKAASDGVVRSIKNDPRYGLTIVINHNDEYQTVYANLLTAEFVSEGETVSQGQTIGTVGNTATFEISDESHLHFEILKDSVQVDPSIYIKGD